MAKLQEAIRWRLITKLLVDWLEASTLLPRDHIIKGRQNANHPLYPSATFNFLSGPTRIGLDDAQVDTTLGTAPNEMVSTTYQGPRLFTASVLIEVGPDGDDNADPDCNAVALMTAAQSELRSITRREAFNSFGLALVRTGPVTDISEMLNGEFVSRASMDVELSTQSVFTEPETFYPLETVAGTATIQQPGQSDITETFDTSS